MKKDKEITFEERTELRFNAMDRYITELQRRIHILEVKPDYSKSTVSRLQVIPQRDPKGNIKR